jgi:hypothetical protein
MHKLEGCSSLAPKRAEDGSSKGPWADTRGRPQHFEEGIFDIAASQWRRASLTSNSISNLSMRTLTTKSNNRDISSIAESS